MLARRFLFEGSMVGLWRAGLTVSLILDKNSHSRSSFRSYLSVFACLAARSLLLFVQTAVASLMDTDQPPLSKYLVPRLEFCPSQRWYTLNIYSPSLWYSVLLLPSQFHYLVRRGPLENQTFLDVVFIIDPTNQTKP